MTFWKSFSSCRVTTLWTAHRFIWLANATCFIHKCSILPRQIIGDLKASSGRQTRNAAKGIVYKPPVKKPRAPRDPNAPKRGKPAKEKEAAKEEAPADDKKEEAEADA